MCNQTSFGYVSQKKKKNPHLDILLKKKKSYLDKTHQTRCQ